MGSSGSDAAAGAQPLGQPVHWTGARRPTATELAGTRVLLRRPRLDDAPALFDAGRDPAIWTYLPYGPYATASEVRERLAEIEECQDPWFYAVCPLPGARPCGLVSLLSIAPERGSIEIGHIWFGNELQRTTAATEAIFLLARHAMDDLGYRRLEWSCNALNARSRRAAERFGFRFEGIFRNHNVMKGRNRDTAWYSIVDDEWPVIRGAFVRWLEPDNFDADG
ncbi:MAG TPA: GNAT family protein, partial [Thermoleophilaceae bacterium]|nr:GNAT family protein [Thermoleophilaceae bacterium]